MENNSRICKLTIKKIHINTYYVIVKLKYQFELNGTGWVILSFIIHLIIIIIIIKMEFLGNPNPIRDIREHRAIIYLGYNSVNSLPSPSFSPSPQHSCIPFPLNWILELPEVMLTSIVCSRTTLNTPPPQSSSPQSRSRIWTRTDYTIIHQSSISHQPKAQN